MQSEAADIKKRKGAGGATGGDTESSVNKLLWSLDARLRHLEGKTPSYFIETDEQYILPALIQANQQYDAKHTKGAAHPMGPRRTSLAAGFLVQIAKANLAIAEGPALAYMNEWNKVAGMTSGMEMAEQQTLLQYLITTYTTAQHLEPEIATCYFSSARSRTRTPRRRDISLLLRSSPIHF